MNVEQNIAIDRAQDPRWRMNPISRRYVLRTGAIWKRLVKSGVVQDEEVAAQLARPAQGTPRKRNNNVIIKADQDAVSGIVRDHFDASRLTGAQLQEIAAELARLNIGTGAVPHARSRGRGRKPAGPQYKALTGVSHRRSSRAPPPRHDVSEDCDESQEDEEDEQTETTACDESQSDAPDPREVAQNISARFSTIRVTKPPARRR